MEDFMLYMLCHNKRNSKKIRRDKSRKKLKNKARGMKLVLALLFIKMHYFKIMIIKTVRSWHRNKETNKWYQVESL